MEKLLLLAQKIRPAALVGNKENQKADKEYLHADLFFVIIVSDYLGKLKKLNFFAKIL